MPAAAREQTLSMREALVVMAGVVEPAVPAVPAAALSLSKQIRFLIAARLDPMVLMDRAVLLARMEAPEIHVLIAIFRAAAPAAPGERQAGEDPVDRYIFKQKPQPQERSLQAEVAAVAAWVMAATVEPEAHVLVVVCLAAAAAPEALEDQAVLVEQVVTGVRGGRLMLRMVAPQVPLEELLRLLPAAPAATAASDWSMPRVGRRQCRRRQFRLPAP